MFATLDDYEVYRYESMVNEEENQLCIIPRLYGGLFDRKEFSS